ncbi:hypothetical protein KKF34_03690 [Myxococcota bacterium]|nr:hypothetical protein [Myxococcota bacterium]MBU1382447.1 hypothetical protein [Myxococcota bacterium]MBU1495958.1 hypothetical protein [Myxococcota bacterium]
MNKEEKKRIRREMEERESRRQALSKVRRIGEDISLSGVGLIRLQIFVCPSFSNGECWDFRYIDNEMNVYKSVVLSENGTIQPGYMKVHYGEKVTKLLSKLESIKVPVFTKQAPIGTLDGTIYRVRFISGSENEVSMSWNSNPPENWSEFLTCIYEMLEMLRSAKLTELEA